MKKLAGITSILLTLPAVAFAQYGTLAPIQALIVSVGNIIALLIPILMGVAFIYFIISLIKYIKGGKAEDRGAIYAGIIAFFVMLSIWGIVHFFQAALLGGTSPTTVQAPHFPTN